MTTLLQKLFSFNGRINRREFFSYLVFTFITTMVILYYFLVLLENNWLEISNPENRYIYRIILLPMAYISVVLATKRLHDINYRWWYQIIPFFMIYWMFAKWNKWPNKFWNETKIDEKNINLLFISSFIAILVFVLWIIKW